MADTKTGRRGTGRIARVALSAVAFILFTTGGAVAAFGIEGGGAVASGALAFGGVMSLAFAVVAARKSPEPARGLPDDMVIEVTRRLTLIESRLDEIDRNGGAAIRASLSELTAEIGLLGGLTKELAEAVAVHDEDLAALGRDNAGAAPPARSEGQGAEATNVGTSNAGKPAAGPRAAKAGAPPVEHESITAREIAAMEADAARAEAILQAVIDDQIVLHLQPIVSLPQRKVQIYEALSRLQVDDDSLLVPAEFMPLAERRGLVAAFDERFFARVLAVARHLSAHGGRAAVLCNVSPLSLADPGFLKVVARLVEEHGDVAGRVVLELPQRAFRTMDADRWTALAGLVKSGLRLSMDRVQDLRLDPVALAERGVRFVKVPAAMLTAGDGEADIHPGDMPSLLARAGIAAIADGVESEAVVTDVLDLNVPLARGQLFGLPRAVRADVFAPARRLTMPEGDREEPEAAVLEIDKGATETGGRKPFRAFLRRASA